MSARSVVFLPGEYGFAMATAGKLSGNLAWRKECGRGSLRAFGQFATHNETLVSDQNSIAPGIIIEKVHIDQPANLDLQPGFLADFSDDGTSRVLINLDIARWHIPLLPERFVSPPDQQQASILFD
jgi:hypothetical protein